MINIINKKKIKKKKKCINIKILKNLIFGTEQDYF